MTMPEQKPGRSFQAYQTPKIFLDAVKKRFGIELFDWDLAATADNAVDGCGSREDTKGFDVARYFGPTRMGPAFRDSLTQDWTKLKGSLWLNPPYADIAPWAEKCAASAWYESEKAYPTRRIFLLVPAAVGSNWFQRHVFNKSLVLLLNPRISFDGKAGFPKDLILACYGLKPSVEPWRWQGKPL
jgi:hypothetical protein